VNFARDVVESAPGASRALVTLDEAGTRRTFSFRDVAERSARLAGTLTQRGVRRGDVVM
jgi:acetyl-CoA synthetase